MRRLRAGIAALLLAATVALGGLAIAAPAEAAAPCMGSGWWTFNGGRTYTYGSWYWVYPNFYARVPGYWKWTPGLSCPI